MKIIKTNKDIDILVDDDKFEELSKYRWYVNNYNGYAYGRINGKNVLMHRYITNCPKGLVVDHLNSNKLDNRLENLEIITQTENTHRSLDKRFPYLRRKNNT